MLEFYADLEEKIEEVLLEIDYQIKLTTRLDDSYEQGRHEYGWWELTMPNYFTVEFLKALSYDSIFTVIDRRLNDVDCPIETWMKLDEHREVKVVQDDEKTVYSIPYYFDKSERL